MTTTERFPIGSTVTVTSRGGITGTVIGHMIDAPVYGDVIKIRFDNGGYGLNTPEQCA